MKHNNRSPRSQDMQKHTALNDNQKLGHDEHKKQLKHSIIQKDKAELMQAARLYLQSALRTNVDDVNDKTINKWLLQDLIPEAGLGVLYGGYGTMKTFVALHLSMCIGTGRRFFGKPTLKGGVVFWHGEGGTGVGKRISALSQKHGLTDYPFMTRFDSRLNFFEGKAFVNIDGITREFLLLDFLREAIKVHEEKTGVKVRLIFVDTLSKATIGMREVDNTDAAVALDRAEMIAKELGITIFFIAHSGKVKANGIRGASAFPANVDTVIRFDVDKSGHRKKPYSFVFEKVKDAESGSLFHFETELISSGKVDYRGRDQTTLVVVERMDIGKVFERATVTPREQLVIDALGTAFKANRADGVKLQSVRNTLTATARNAKAADVAIIEKLTAPGSALSNVLAALVNKDLVSKQGSGL